MDHLQDNTEIPDRTIREVGCQQTWPMLPDDFSEDFYSTAAYPNDDQMRLKKLYPDHSMFPVDSRPDLTLKPDGGTRVTSQAFREAERQQRDDKRSAKDATAKLMDSANALSAARKRQGEATLKRKPSGRNQSKSPIDAFKTDPYGRTDLEIIKVEFDGYDPRDPKQRLAWQRFVIDSCAAGHSSTSKGSYKKRNMTRDKAEEMDAVVEVAKKSTVRAEPTTDTNVECISFCKSTHTFFYILVMAILTLNSGWGFGYHADGSTSKVFNYL